MSRNRLTMRIAAAERSAEKKKDNRARGEMQRNIEGFDYDPSKATVLKKALHNINVSLGTMISAMKDLSILRGSDITPDGMLGGRGFIMPFRELKAKLSTAITELSDVTDTLADELTNPKWGLSDAEKKKVKQDTENLDEEVQNVEEEVVPSGDTEEGTPDAENTDLPPEVDKPNLDEINPDDVVDSFEVEALKRYGDLIDGNVKDKVASILSKGIMANLSKGDK
jgi:hypothetical protein